MELISLYYFTELAKDLHFTRTADRLFISQQTLSNHIARLEDYYGTKLLHRKPFLSLTTAGEYVLASAKAVLKEDTNLKDMLSDIEEQERGVIRFGASGLRINTGLPYILPQFSARYPKVEIRLTDAISSKLTEQVLNGQLDMAIVVSHRQDRLLMEHHLMDDQVYLCVADSLLRQYYGDETDALKQRALHGASVTDFAKLPFCLLENRIGELIYDSFAEANITPWAYITSTYTQISYTICTQRLAAAFLPRVCLADQSESIPDDINIFPITVDGKRLIQEVKFIHLKDRYMSGPFRFFLELLLLHFREFEQISLERIV